MAAGAVVRGDSRAGQVPRGQNPATVRIDVIGDRKVTTFFRDFKSTPLDIRPPRSFS
jgi:hypothetical protein